MSGALEDAAVLPEGFRAAGVHCGLKPSAPDLALFVSDHPATGAGVFTTNRVTASCVAWCREVLGEGGTVRAIVVNSGNANACTGAGGKRDTAQMAGWTAEHLGISGREALVSSTGPIGVPLPMEKIAGGIRAAAAAATPEGGEAAARAMLTTDTMPKHLTVALAAGGVPVRVTGIAKGAGMIHPGMATMLAYFFTDAAVNRDALRSCLSAAIEASFNRITVDGDRSTNDTALFLANGAAGNEALHPGHADWAAFCQAVDAIALGLARKIVRDGEGATRLVTVRVRGAASDGDADRAARAIGNSLLIKTSWAGGDPNWGRVLCALGYSGADVRPEEIDVTYDNVPAVRGGAGAGTPVERLREVTTRPAYTLDVALHRGNGEAVLYACDITEEFVRINVEE